MSADRSKPNITLVPFADVAAQFTERAHISAEQSLSYYSIDSLFLGGLPLKFFSLFSRTSILVIYCILSIHCL